MTKGIRVSASANMRFASSAMLSDRILNVFLTIRMNPNWLTTGKIFNMAIA